MDFFLAVFFLLLCGHALADYSLQTDFIAKGKSRLAPPGPVPWYYIMASHELIHGGTVAGVLIMAFLCAGHQPLLVPIAVAIVGSLESVLHFGIDMLKCEGLTNIHQDQAAHVACKLLYSLLFVNVT